MKPLPRRTLALVLFTAASCGDGEATASWSRVAPDAMSAEQEEQREHALAAQRALGSTLMGRLGSALEEGGPAHAIGVCRDVAGEIAAQAAAEHGVDLGRTSHRLRNPDNAPPSWAEPWVERRVEEPVWLEHADGRLAGLTPIRAAELCLNCHGTRADLEAGVREELARLYPQDEATGFAAGDLRGWFWMVAPPPGD